MKTWNKYTKYQKVKFYKKYKVTSWGVMNNILSKHFSYYTKNTWNLLKNYKIIN